MVVVGADDDAVVSSADVVVVVDVGVVDDGAVMAPLGVPCEVIVVDVVGTLGALGVITVWLVTADAPDPVVELPAPVVTGAGVVVLSAKDTPAREVHASIVALTIKSFWDRIERSP
jgi:hypothetical protein